MANDCLNRLTVEHEDEETIEEVICAYYEGNLLEYFKPLPEQTDRYSRYEHWSTDCDNLLPGAGPRVERLNDKKVVLHFATRYGPPFNALKDLDRKGFTVTLIFFVLNSDEYGWFVDNQETTLDTSTYNIVQDLLLTSKEIEGHTYYMLR